MDVIFGNLDLWSEAIGNTLLVFFIGGIIALVLGSIVELTFHQTLETFGPSGFFTRPIALALFAVAVLVLLGPLLTRVYRLVVPRRPRAATPRRLSASTWSACSSPC